MKDYEIGEVIWYAYGFPGPDFTKVKVHAVEATRVLIEDIDILKDGETFWAPKGRVTR